MQSIIRHFPQAEIVAKTRRVKKELRQFGIRSKLYPTFPDILVMPRHTARKYPEPRMKKIGLRHGAYHFKDFVKADRYHAFDIYLVTSPTEVELAKAKGIKNCYSVGFPKLDAAFDGSITEKDLRNLREKLNFKPAKPVIIFTTTWTKSGMSAIEKWYQRLEELSGDYEILVTVHHWTEPGYTEFLRQQSSIHFVEDKNILPYLMIADIMIADMSSIISEFCALDKPVVTFRVPEQKRTSREILNMLEHISYRIDTFEELKQLIPRILKNPAEQSAARQKYNRIMFEKLDGKSGERAADLIKQKFNIQQDLK